VLGLIRFDHKLPQLVAFTCGERAPLQERVNYSLSKYKLGSKCLYFLCSEKMRFYVGVQKR
jgi:hypothetical protein